ncbi:MULTISPECIES: preprotein translocase subunit YajC [unclassified Crossiella]|uniref:preprotein translocase subunit YajC n=2 Tax=unclassified Crossiella TaxID=2620835 RepID=UPI001FFFA7F7|nr:MULTISPECIES: preprotein translocase subunit YajC [unclassified Crossiella]MCK2239435.1 preprotein translocase subunit YajC [Crossiella sp. S99.2]MCK2252130.1 preprotein translocase subunit YajC [Crossiella sp. S99.1]
MDPSFIFPLLIVGLGVMMFLSVRKQKRAIADQQSLQNSLAPGDRVMTTSGLYATVVDAEDDTTILLELAPGVTTEWVRAAVREKVKDTADEDVDVDEVDETPAPAAAEKANESKAEIAPPLEQGKNNR